MTNDLEKQFFDTFGIEPIEFEYDIGVWNNELGCSEEHIVRVPYIHYEKYARCPEQVKGFIYPQITDRILLELICLCPDLDEVFFTDIAKLKETLLTSYINTYKYYTEVERLSDCEKELRHQVRTLFEEG